MSRFIAANAKEMAARSMEVRRRNAEQREAFDARVAHEAERQAEKPYDASSRARAYDLRVQKLLLQLDSGDGKRVS